jgi:hypothetical protein
MSEPAHQGKGFNWKQMKGTWDGFFHYPEGATAEEKAKIRQSVADAAWTSVDQRTEPQPKKDDAS